MIRMSYALILKVWRAMLTQRMINDLNAPSFTIASFTISRITVQTSCSVSKWTGLSTSTPPTKPQIFFMPVSLVHLSVSGS